LLFYHNDLVHIPIWYSESIPKFTESNSLHSKDVGAGFRTWLLVQAWLKQEEFILLSTKTGGDKS